MCFDLLFSVGSPKSITLSDLRKYTCTKDASSLEYNQLSVEIEGTVFRCHEVTQTDPNYVAWSDGTYVVSCVPLKSTLEEEKYSASRGQFLVTDFKKNKNYMCLDITKKGDRMSRGFSNPIDWAYEGTGVVLGAVKSTLGTTKVIPK